MQPREIQCKETITLAKKKKAASPSFEEALAQVEDVVAQLEDGQLGLNESLAQYELGVKALKQCYATLESAERKIELLTGVDAEGNPVTVEVEDEEMTLDEKAKGRSKRRSATTEDADSGETLF